MAGREFILSKVEIILNRLKVGKSEKSFLFVGLRGVGKTVLLNKIDETAKKYNFQSVYIEAHEEKSLVALLTPYLRQILFQLKQKKNTSKVIKALRVFKSFLGAVKLKFNNVEISLDIEPELGIADSGDLETDIPSLLECIAEAVKEQGTAISIIIDELQFLSKTEFSTLIIAIHRIAQKQLPVILIGAGLPQLVALAGRSKSYAERLFDFPKVGPLDKNNTFKALHSKHL